jgi:hypothetical protein
MAMTLESVPAMTLEEDSLASGSGPCASAPAPMNTPSKIDWRKRFIFLPESLTAKFESGR